MYRPGRPVLSNSEMRELKQLARDGFETAKQMADPPQSVVVVRDDLAGGVTEFYPVEALIQYDQGSSGQGMGGESTSIVGTTGTIRREAPWDLRLGDRVRLGNGEVLIITAPKPYERFGVIRGRWRIEEGTP